MSNEIRISSSIEVVRDDDFTGDGIPYSVRNLDGNADSRSWGGYYVMDEEFDADAVCYWNNVVVDVTSATSLADGSAFEGNVAVTDGTIPVTIYAIAVEFTKMLGTSTDIYITLSGEVMARIHPGEAVVLPFDNGGEAIADCKIHAGHYTDGSREATVNVMLVGND